MEQSRKGFVFVKEDEKKLNNEVGNLSNQSYGPWWKSGVQIFSEVSTWIVIPVVCALVFGKMLDTNFGTKPLFFLSLTGLAFLFSCYGIFKSMKNYIKKLQDIDEKKNLKKD